MSLSKQELVTLSDRYTIAELRQLIKAHNRFDDIRVPKKMKKEKLIESIYGVGFRLSDKGMKKLSKVRKPRPTTTTISTSLEKAKQMKANKYPNNRSGYGKAK